MSEQNQIMDRTIIIFCTKLNIHLLQTGKRKLEDLTLLNI